MAVDVPVHPVRKTAPLHLDTVPMEDAPAPTATAAAPQWQPLQLASANLLNLALPGRSFYDNQQPYSSDDYERKLAWLGAMFARLEADVLGVQEVWDEAALKAAVLRGGLRRHVALAPGAENCTAVIPVPGAGEGGGAGSGAGGAGEANGGGAQGTPRVGLVTRLAIEQIESIADFAPQEAVTLPEIGPITRFERPVLRAMLRAAPGLLLHVLVVHLKSKRPKYLQDASGRVLEDRDDPAITARATMRALLQRAAEAAALRRIVVGITGRAGPHQGEPLVLLGDMNDTAHAVTTRMIAADQAAAYDRGARDVALYHALDVATAPALRRDLTYSHIHQGWPELLDQIWVSEELVASSRFAIGDIRRVEVFNDHLHESRECWRSDHGFVRALARLRR